MQRENVVHHQVCHLTFCEASKSSGLSFSLARSKDPNHGTQVIMLTSFPPCLYGNDNLSLLATTKSRTYTLGKRSVLWLSCKAWEKGKRIVLVTQALG